MSRPSRVEYPGAFYHVMERGLTGLGRIFYGDKGSRGVKPGMWLCMYMVRQLCDRSLKGIAEVFSLESYGSVGGACGVIESRIRFERTPRRHIEGGTEMVSSPSIQKKS
jgi:hypothetical protein